MPDLLTHALIGYTIATTLGFRYRWLTPPWVTVCMMGTFIPDLTKIRLLIPNYRVEQYLGTPFDWFGLHTAGGSVVSVLIGAILVPREYRRRVFALLTLGAGSHLLFDAFLIKTSGHMSPMLWPITDFGFAMPGFYLSSDRWPALVTGILAALVWLATQRSHRTH